MSKKQSSFHLGNEFNGYGTIRYLKGTQPAVHPSLSQENVHLSPDFKMHVLKMIGSIPVVINAVSNTPVLLALLGTMATINRVIVTKDTTTGNYDFKFNITSNQDFTNGSFLYGFRIEANQIPKTMGVNGKDYFVIIRRGTVNIRESASSRSQSLKTLGAGEAVKVVVPIVDVNSEGIVWNEVYVDKELKKKGWISKSYIYPDETFITEYLNHPTINFKSVTGIFNGTSKTEDYIQKWGAPGKGNYPPGQGKANGRLLVAVPPKVIYPDYPDDWGIQNEDITAFSRNITVHLRAKVTKATLDLLCYVKDIKAHTYRLYPDGHNNTILPKGTKGEIIGIPNGIIQTGIAYPNSDNAKANLACSIGHMNGNVVEFCGWKVTDINCNDYELVSISSNETRHTYKY